MSKACFFILSFFLVLLMVSCNPNNTDSYDTSYTVVFDANGATIGNVPDSIQSDNYGGIIMPDSGTLRRPGYYFVAWNSEEDGNGQIYIPNSSYFYYPSSVSNDFVPSEDGTIVLYAMWDKIDEGFSFVYIPSLDGYCLTSCPKGVDFVVVPSFYDGKNVVAIGPNAFNGCNLTNISIPSTVNVFAYGAFSVCNEVTVILGEGWSFIPNELSSICSSLVIPSSVTDVKPESLSFPSEFNSIDVSLENDKYYSDGNCIVERKTGILVLGCNSSIIPSNVTSIGNYAFKECHSLTEITIPSNVTSIGDDAFSWCTGLKKVSISEGVSEIGDEAFVMCSGLTEVTIPSSVTFIGNRTFYGCNELNEIQYNSSKTDWERISKEDIFITGKCIVHCIDGDIIGV